MGCVSTPAVKTACEKAFEAKEQTVVANLQEENEYLYWIGAELAQKMKEHPKETQCVYVNLFMMHRNLANTGVLCAEYKEGDLYLCEESCDYVAGEEVTYREYECKKVVE
jgi:hypothetical protein